MRNALGGWRIMKIFIPNPNGIDALKVIWDNKAIIEKLANVEIKEK